jgi:hypothetical protein
MQAITEHHCQREEEILTKMHGQTCSAYQIAANMDWKVPWEQLPVMHQRMAIGEIIAHLEHLRWQGKLKRLVQENHFLFKPFNP